MKRYVRCAYEFDRSKFNDDQIHEIQQGLDHGVDVSIYADPRFDAEQMFEIRVGLEDGTDVSIYADPKYTSTQMEAIQRCQEVLRDIDDIIIVKKGRDDYETIYQKFNT